MPSVLQPVVVTRCRLMWYHLRDCDGERTVTTSNLITVIFSPGPVLADAAVLLTDPFNYLGLTMLLTIEGGAHCGGWGGCEPGHNITFLGVTLTSFMYSGLHLLQITVKSTNKTICRHLDDIYWLSAFKNTPIHSNLLNFWPYKWQC